MASTSVLAVSTAAQAACMITNPSTPFTNSSTIDCITFDDGLTHSGDVANASPGVINATGVPGRTGISILQGSTLVGGIVNNGTITAPSGGAGIGVIASTVTGDIVNNKTIGAGVGGVGLGVAAGTLSGTFTPGIVQGSLINNGTITVGPGGAGIAVNAGTVGGNIVNGATGVITANGPGGVGIGVRGTSSAALVGGTIVGGITNNGTINVNGAGGRGIAVVGASSSGFVVPSTVGGGILNTGTINANGLLGAGVFVGGSTVAGGITNASTINANGPGGSGVLITPMVSIPCGCSGSTPVIAPSVVTGGITNTGTINANGALGAGVRVIGSTIDSISNTGLINANGPGGAGIAVRGVSVPACGGCSSTFVTRPGVVTGGISNTGTINTGGVLGAGVRVLGGIVSGGISNGGVITASNTAGTGILVGPAGAFLFSSGAAIAGAESQSAALFAVSSSGAFVRSTINGGITNSGTINTNGLVGGGIRVIASTVNGDIANSGTINANGTGGVGIAVTSLLTSFGCGCGGRETPVTRDFPAATTVGTAIVNGNVVNSGTINATGPSGNGIRVLGSLINGTVTNSGTINTGPSGTGILLASLTSSGFSPARVTGGIVNTGTINAGVTIDTSRAGIATTIFQNAGALNGAVLLSQTSADVFNIAGGTVNGQITGGAPTVLNMTGGTLVVATNFNNVVGTYKQGGGKVNFNVTPSTAPGTYGSITSLGPASVGGTFNAVEKLGFYASTQVYKDVFITPARSGDFVVASQSPLFTASLIPGSGGGNQSLLLAFTGVPTIGLTPNEQAAAGGLNSIFFNGPLTGNAELLYDAFFGLTLGQIPGALDFLSGEIHGDVQSVLTEDSAYFRNAILDRLRQLAGGSGPMAALGTGGPTTAFADPSLEEGSLALAYASSKRPVFPIKAPPRALPVYDPGVVYWAQGVGAWGKLNGDGNAADTTRRLGGFFTGVDQRFGEWRAGVAAGYSNSTVNVSARTSSANIDTAHIGAYGGASYGPWNLRTGGALSFSEVLTNRLIAFPGFADAAGARYGATTGQVFGEVGYGMRVWNYAVEPFGGLAFVSLHTDSFNEIGGAAALAGQAATENVGYSSLGLRAATVYLLQNGWVVIPRASLAWQHAYGDVVPSASLAFLAGGTPFTIFGVPIARNAARAEAGVEMRVNPQATLGVGYTGELASNARDHSVKGTFSWKF